MGLRHKVGARAQGMGSCPNPAQCCPLEAAGKTSDHTLGNRLFSGGAPSSRLPEKRGQSQGILAPLSSCLQPDPADLCSARERPSPEQANSSCQRGPKG